MGGTTADGRFTLLPIVCLGACDQAPAMLVDDDLHGTVDPENGTALILEALRVSEFAYPTHRRTSAPTGCRFRLDEYVASGGYAGAAPRPHHERRRRHQGAHGLRTCGAAAAPASPRAASGASCSAASRRRPKYIACNADEMEPGSFKDRILMERNPHLLLEGMLIAAYATEATTAYIFIRGEYARVARVLERAMDEARAGRLPGRQRPGLRLQLRDASCTSAPAATCAAKRRPCSTRWRASAPIHERGRRT